MNAFFWYQLMWVILDTAMKWIAVGVSLYTDSAGSILWRTLAFSL